MADALADARPVPDAEIEVGIEVEANESQQPPADFDEQEGPAAAAAQPAAAAAAAQPAAAAAAAQPAAAAVGGVQVDQRTVQSLAADHQAALINETSAKTASADALEAKKTADEKKKRAAAGPVPGASTPLRRAATKRSRAARTSVTDLMETDAEKLWSAKTRGFFEFDKISPINGLPIGAVGVASGPKGDAAFYSYIEQSAVIARLEAEGFKRADKGAPHPWYLPWKPGVVSPSEKALCRALTDEQRARIEGNRIAALERGRQRVEKGVAALHGELPDDAMAAHDSEKS